MDASHYGIIGQDLLKYIQHVRCGYYIVFLIVVLCTAKTMRDAHKKRTLPARDKLSAFPIFITFFGVLAEMFLCLFIGNMLDAITISGIDYLVVILIVSLMMLGVQIIIIIASHSKSFCGKTDDTE